MEVLTFSDGEGDEEEFAMTGSVLSDYFTQVGLDHNFDSSNDALDDQHPKTLTNFDSLLKPSTKKKTHVGQSRTVLEDIDGSREEKELSPQLISSLKLFQKRSLSEGLFDKDTRIATPKLKETRSYNNICGATTAENNPVSSTVGVCAWFDIG